MSQDTGDPKQCSGSCSNESSQKKKAYPLYVAKCDFFAFKSNELSFKKGNLLYIMYYDKRHSCYYARAKDTGKEGVVYDADMLEEYKPLEKCG